jgi:hypothetical protein
VSTAQTSGSRSSAVALTCGSNRFSEGLSLTCQSAWGPSFAYGGAGSLTGTRIVRPPL